ncbi:hypothetical protein [Budvicia aquatica]|uniref:hypothetical protein n=1 Tax=Budvicia aquatica TaxID=82979 RepID=UPI00207DA7AA|nr:hypothetical protein [Budvicia aquatica]GKX52210.1 hypothetical protein SOASR029_25190 [Budvicia aquatica]
MSEKILFVFEGEKTEHVIARNFISHYIQKENKTVIKISFCGEIYQLYKKMSEDDFGIEFVDLFPLLQERDENLKKYKRDDFSQIYLFFDYDPHATNASNSILNELLDVFCQETEKGKLFVSYPMVESIRCYNGIEDNFMDLLINIDEVAYFKQTVNSYAHKKYNNVPQWTINIWSEVIDLHCRKANLIVHSKNDFPEREVPQDLILTKQIEHENKSNNVIVISAFPLMLLSHYGEKTASILQNLA